MCKTAMLLLFSASLWGQNASEPPPLRPSEELETVVKDLNQRINDLIASVGDDGGDWVGDRARLEMQLATARLEMAVSLLDETLKKDTLPEQKKDVLKTLREVEHVDRTLDRVSIERLDDYDRRTYRGLSSMRHRVSSMQIYALLQMIGEAPPVGPEEEDPKKDDPKKDDPEPPTRPCSRVTYVTRSCCHRCVGFCFFLRRRYWR
ncbi:MAG: hypothetical protein RIC55_30795 [Pirellulaceae bacterium]